jgi:AraC-like DNA-binding protein
MMHRNYADSTLNINRIAEELGVHRTTLSRTFLKAKGISPIHYFQSYRVQKALSYLKETRFTIAEIASLCGFADVDYFAKVVRRATGCSPREFRNR